MTGDVAVRFDLVLAVLGVVLGGLAFGGLAISRWARRTGRRPWVWLVGAYVALTIVWPFMSTVIR